MDAKEIIMWIIILVFAMTIFSYIFNPQVRNQVKVLTSNIKEKIINAYY